MYENTVEMLLRYYGGYDDFSCLVQKGADVTLIIFMVILQISHKNWLP